MALGLAILLVGLLAGLWLHVHDRHMHRRAVALDSWLALEAEIVDGAARATEAWMTHRIDVDGLSVHDAEQEVFRQFIDPIQLGKDGDAWIYNQGYVIFDESEDFPRQYLGKSMAEIFAMQVEHGARHYDALIEGVETASTGTTWYVWLPEKGREFAAWTSVRVHDDTWTIGLSTPEAQILDFFRVPQTLLREAIGAATITVLLLGLALALWLKHRSDTQRLAVLRTSHARLEQAVAERTRRLEAMNQDLRRSNEDLEQFAYAASHDLQAPLRTISSFLGLLRQRYGGSLDADATEFITYSIEGAKRLSQQIHGLLDFSRVTTQGQQMEPVALERVVENALALLRGPIAESGARVILPETRPTVTVDPSQVTTLFQNLIANALKYTRPGIPPEVRIQVHAEGPRWRVAVTDNGIGIAPQYHGRIFGVFQRLHGPAEFEGTGIGLALCKRIVDRHGGDLTVESDGETGSTFTFTLPGVATDRQAVADTAWDEGASAPGAV
ncbi:sensor histidine kinase [Roseospira navarrensis]|uniref:sensor histidine kinase n=1 Tax=Roseospira navarrensis TaxID=140058 RepID=UPI0014788D06|nr:ATP-binding protein [Roseospira navarrensis]